MGYSLGECVALSVVSVLTANDAIFLFSSSILVRWPTCQINSHKMLAVCASLEDIETAAGNMPYEIACVNGPKDTVPS